MPNRDDAHLHSGNAPRHTEVFIPIAQKGSITTSSRLLAFTADKAYEVLGLMGAPTTISSGALKLDLLVAGVSIAAVKPSAAVADVPIAGTFVSTRIASGATVLVRTTSDSSTVTDVFGYLLLRPILGKELLP